MKDRSENDLIELYTLSYDAQKHFNELCTKIRNFLITIFTFFLAGIGFCFKESIILKINCFELHLATIVSIIGFFVVLAFFILDYLGYHKLLVASVKQGINLENEIKRQYSSFELTSLIKIESTEGDYRLQLLPFYFLKILHNLFFSILNQILKIINFIPNISLKLYSINYNYVKLDSSLRIKIFYFFIAFPFMVITIFGFFSTDVVIRESKKNNEIINKIISIEKKIDMSQVEYKNLTDLLSTDIAIKENKINNEILEKIKAIEKKVDKSQLEYRNLIILLSTVIGNKINSYDDSTGIKIDKK